MIRRLAILSVAPLALAALAILGVRALLGFQFPVPWPDETSFLTQAYALATTGSLFDPGLNPDRLVMWMPPGYMAALAILFHVFGYSFALARWFSAMCCLACLALVAVLVSRATAEWRRVAACWLAGAAFLSPFVLVDANLARMEMLFALVILAALFCLAEGKVYVGAALVALAGVVHFNAVYFVPGVLVAGGIEAWHRRLRWPTPGDTAALAAAAVVVGLYGVLVLRHWQGFVTDITYQIELKDYFGAKDPAHPDWVVAAGAVLAAAALARWPVPRGASALALFGVGFIVMAHQGHEIWYDYGQPLGFALIAAASLAYSSTRWRLAPALAAGVLVGVMAVRITPALAPLLPTRAMLGRNFVAPDQIARVRRFIATLPPGTRVNFGWSGMEPFFLADLARAGARWTMVGHSVTSFFPPRAYDWRVRCDSVELPPGLLHFDIDYPRHGRDTGCDMFKPPVPAAPAPPR